MISAGDDETANRSTADRPAADTTSVDATSVDAPTVARLTGSAEWFWYVAAAVGYVNFGIWHKWLLNWVVGPVWLVTVVCLGPAVVDKIRRIAGRIGR
jgi:hypothetical protein